MCMSSLRFYGIPGMNEYRTKIHEKYNVWVAMVEEYDMYDKE